MILVIDNFDSFVFNLARYIENAGAETIIVRNNAINLADIEQLSPSHIVISPGPGTPSQAGISLEVIRQFCSKIPILGVCLGHQAIGQVFGAVVTFAKYPMHGKASLVSCAQSEIFANLPKTILVGRYHSLIVDGVTENLPIRITATSTDGETMALQHKEYPVFGVQFHPESILTDSGMRIIQNFINL